MLSPLSCAADHIVGSIVQLDWRTGTCMAQQRSKYGAEEENADMLKSFRLHFSLSRFLGKNGFWDSIYGLTR